MTPATNYDEIVLNAASSGAWGSVRVNGRAVPGLAWSARSDGGVNLYPTGEDPVMFLCGEYRAFRLWVENYHRRNV